MDKSVDLGKMQNELTALRSQLKVAKTASATAFTNYQRAIETMERKANVVKTLTEAVDKYSRAVVEAARTVTQG
jgi:hypothetical protein